MRKKRELKKSLRSMRFLQKFDYEKMPYVASFFQNSTKKFGNFLDLQIKQILNIGSVACYIRNSYTETIIIAHLYYSSQGILE